MLYSNTLNIAVTLSLCNTKHQQYTFTCHSLGFQERKLKEFVFFIPFYLSVRNNRRNVECIITNLDISDI